MASPSNHPRAHASTARRRDEVMKEGMRFGRVDGRARQSTCVSSGGIEPRAASRAVEVLPEDGRYDYTIDNATWEATRPLEDCTCVTRRPHPFLEKSIGVRA